MILPDFPARLVRSPMRSPCLLSACLVLCAAIVPVRAAGFFPPAGGWDYRYDGDAAASPSDGALDGTWDHDNASDHWDGTAPGTGNPGGVAVVPLAGEPGNNALLMVDAVTTSGFNNNRRLALTHNLAVGEGVPGTFLNDGATLAFRLRLPSAAPDLSTAPNGLDPHSGAKGIVNLKQDDGRLSFAFGVAGTDPAYAESGMFVSDGGETVFHALDPTAWNEFWVTIDRNDSDPARYDLHIYLNGAGVPSIVDSVRLSAGVEESYPYLSLQLSSTADSAAVEIDYVAFKDGAHLPDDSDRDSLPDSWELAYFPDLSRDEDGDEDSDGLTNGEEFNLGSNPTLADTDGDGLSDGDEFNQHGSDPTLRDTDGDGLEDEEEVNETPATDPTEADTDGDGLNDGAEVLTHHTDPTRPDTDGDGFDDATEIASGSDPLDPDEVPSFPSLGGVLINEFMASNAGSRLDLDGDSSDWLELWNPTGAAIEIGGWLLTDDPADPTKWRLPDGLVLGSGNFLVIYASEKDRAVLGSELHTDFRLDKAAGSHLALRRPDGVGGTTTVSAYALYPEQVEDVSFGAHGDTSPLAIGYFTTPTPGAANGPSATEGFVADTSFSLDRGFYDQAIEVVVSSATPGATIIYTTDGSLPTSQNGTAAAAPDPDTPPAVTIPIGTTTCLRAYATRPGFQPTNVDTQTYIFPRRVLRQRTPSEPFANWGHAGPDYEMDPQIAAHSDPEVRPVADDLKRLPTVSLVMNWAEMFGNGGIYISGEGVERDTSIEYINPLGDPVDPNTVRGFQVDGTVQVVGGSSTGRWKSDNLSLRLKFSPDLRYPFFGEEATDRFDTLVLDARLVNAWHYGGGADPSSQRGRAQYTRDQFPADLHNLMGGLSPHGRKVLLYINGVFWGMRGLHERPDDNFAAEYLGGDNDDYDAMKHRITTVVKGSAANYSAMLDLTRRDMNDQARFEAVTRVLHIDNFLSYMIMNFYIGNTDWAHQNWYATYNKVSPEGRWYYHSWDPEHCLEDNNTNVTTKDDPDGPTEVFQNLIANPEFRLKFADHVHRHFHNEGVLTPGNVAATYLRMTEPIDLVTRLESARWGDNWRSNPFTRHDWLANRDQLLGNSSVGAVGNFFPRRTGTVLGQFRSRGWYPDRDPPVLSQHGGEVPAHFPVSITSPGGGRIYYTLDGSDPRTPATGASVRDHVLVPEGASKRAILPADGSMDQSWFTANFDDSSWPTGTLGAGYDRVVTYAALLDPAFDFIGEVDDQRQESVFMRIDFEVADPSQIDTMTLGVRYDDGYVAYLNGTEIARVNAGGLAGTPLPFDAGASAGHRDSESMEFLDKDVSGHVGLLRAGPNVLALHGLNSGTDSSDMLLDATLTATETVGSEPSGIAPQAQRYTGSFQISRPETVVSARVFTGSDWSALTRATFLVDVVPADATNLVVSKIHYRPAELSAVEIAAGHGNRRDFEYLEMMNIGAGTLNFTGVEFTVGLDFEFSSGDITVVGPGERVLLVADLAAFKFRHGTGLPVAGQFDQNTNLANGGERLTLLAADQTVIRDFAYDDEAPWPTGADGGGAALVLVDPESNPDHALASSWRASFNSGGNPGGPDTGLAYLAWEVVHGLTGGPTDDPDHDQHTNLEEYRFGSNPLVADAAAFVPGIEAQQFGDSAYAVLRVRIDLAATDATWRIGTTTDLINWSEDTTGVLEPLPPTDLGDGTRLLNFKILPALHNLAVPARFFRLTIEL